MKRISALLLLLALTSIPISCVEDDYDCGDLSVTDFEITELLSSVGTFDSTGFSNSTSINFQEAAISISIAEIRDVQVAQLKENRFSLVNYSYACSPVEPQLAHTITVITITSESSVFGNGRVFSPGEDLSELFKITHYNNSNEELTIDEFIVQHKVEPQIFGSIGQTMVMQLSDKPDQPIDQTFNFLFEFSDSEIISLETATFEVSN